MAQRIAYATMGEMSNIPSGGSRFRSGATSHSVSVNDQRIQREYGEILTHEEITRTMRASCRSPMVHVTINPRIARGPFETADSKPTMLSRTKPSRLRTTMPPMTTARSVHNGAAVGRPPERTTARSTGAIAGSTVFRKNRAAGPNGLNRRVRTSQSPAHTTPVSAAPPRKT